MRHVWPDMLSVLPAQTRRATRGGANPGGDTNRRLRPARPSARQHMVAYHEHADAFFPRDRGSGKASSPSTFAAFVVCRRYWRDNFKTVRKLGQKQGGRYVGGVHFEYPGGQLRSLLSLTSYLGSGEYRDRYMGIRIPTTNVQPEQLEQTREFASALADRLFGRGSAIPREETV